MGGCINISMVMVMVGGMVWLVTIAKVGFCVEFMGILLRVIPMGAYTFLILFVRLNLDLRSSWKWFLVLDILSSWR